MFNARQLSFGLLDQAIHSETIPEDTWAYYNNLTIICAFFYIFVLY